MIDIIHFMKINNSTKSPIPQGAIDSTTYAPLHSTSVRVYMVFVIYWIVTFYHENPVSRNLTCGTNSPKWAERVNNDQKYNDRQQRRNIHNKSQSNIRTAKATARENDYHDRH